ncbi:membrane protein [Streptococcus salivarius]|nr:membrane protein [Streptococcus salivarius]
MAMFAVLLLKNSRIKSYFAIMGVIGTYCALIYPVFDPYEFPHITGFSFLIGHYALLVNSLNVIFNSYKTHPISKRLIVVATLLLNLALVIVNQTIGGNYGMLKHTPFIMGTPLLVKYLAVSGALIILMIIMKKGLEHFEE